MKQLIPYLICFFIGLILYIIYQFRKVQILKYISKWPWGVRIIENEYFKTMFKREKNRLKSVNKAIKLAQMRNKIESLKMYVIEVEKGVWWWGSMNEFTLIQKKNKKLSGLWPPRDAVFQTR